MGGLLQETLALFVAFFIFSILVLFVLQVSFNTIGDIEYEIWMVDWISDLLF